MTTPKIKPCPDCEYLKKYSDLLIIDNRPDNYIPKCPKHRTYQSRHGTPENERTIFNV